jgi:multicomponent Na+:H+ antiporter subunit D
MTEHKGKGLKPKKIPNNMIFAMSLVAFFCCLHGIMPSLLYKLLPYPVHFEPYTIPHLVESGQILIFTFVGFWLFRKKLRPHAVITLDLDWLFRRSAGLFRKIFVEGIDSFFKWTTDRTMALVGRSARLAKNPVALFSRDQTSSTYSPDTSRPRMQSILIFVLLTFIILVLIGLLAS